MIGPLDEYDDDEEFEILDENNTKNMQNNSSLFPTGPPTKYWSVPELREFLKHHRKKTSNMNKAPLLHLASVTWSNYSKSEFSAEDILKIRAVEKDLIEKRKVFDKGDLDWKDIFEFGKDIIPKEFSSDVINSFLRSNFVTIQDEMVYSEIDKPAVKGQEMYYSDMIQRCQTAFNEDLVMFRAEIGASMRDVVR